MIRRRPIRVPKKPIFLGCEGDSEVAYGQVLNDLLRSSDVPVHLHVEALARGAGDPLARVRRALQRIAELENRRSRFRLAAILLDFDQAERDPARADRAKRLATQNNLALIWQHPCHEALLLRHMPDCSNHRPLDCRVAQQQLERVWPEYKKAMPRALLARRIDLDAVRQAAGVEPELRVFLEAIRLLH